MRAEELREWVGLSEIQAKRCVGHGEEPGWICQRRVACDYVHGTRGDVLICNLTEALRQTMKRVETLEAYARAVSHAHEAMCLNCGQSLTGQGPCPSCGSTRAGNI